MPRAMQAKEARDMNRMIILGVSLSLVRMAWFNSDRTLAKTMNKWLETYRTKIALKAVAWVPSCVRLTTLMPICLIMQSSEISPSSYCGSSKCCDVATNTSISTDGSQKCISPKRHKNQKYRGKCRSWTQLGTFLRQK